MKSSSAALEAIQDAWFLTRGWADTIKVRVCCAGGGLYAIVVSWLLLIVVGLVSAELCVSTLLLHQNLERCRLARKLSMYTHTNCTGSTT